GRRLRAPGSCAATLCRAVKASAWRSGLLGPPTFQQLSPASFGDVDVVFASGGADATPRLVAIGVADALDLIEAGDCISNMPRVDQRLLALSRERKRPVGKFVLLGGAERSTAP